MGPNGPVPQMLGGSVQTCSGNMEFCCTARANRTGSASAGCSRQPLQDGPQDPVGQRILVAAPEVASHGTLPGHGARLAVQPRAFPGEVVVGGDIGLQPPHFAHRQGLEPTTQSQSGTLNRTSSRSPFVSGPHASGRRAPQWTAGPGCGTGSGAPPGAGPAINAGDRRIGQ